MKKITAFSLLLTSVSLTVSLTVNAVTPSFDFVQVGYVHSVGSLDLFRGVSLDEVGFGRNGVDDMDGFEYKVNYKINEHYYFNAEHLSASAEHSDTFVDLVLGFGYITKLTDNSILYSQFDLRYGGSSEKFDRNEDVFLGLTYSLGSRMMVSDNLEVNFAVKPTFYKVSEDDNETGPIETRVFFELGAVYSFTDNLGAYIKLESNIDSNTVAIGARYSF